mmetsp:Transcript_49830/g.118789  ORF Transcript_49830/g.118789 Transcript_49830/m.118789 type:complete len:254 (+) Transcript_49830:462-1223(+)
MPSSLLVLVKDQASIGTAKAKGVRSTAQHFPLVPLCQDLHAFCFVHQVLDVDGLRQEAPVHHQQGVDGLVHASGAQGVARHGLGGAHEGLVALGLEDPLHGAQLLDVPDGRGGAVGVHVVHLLFAANLVCHIQGNLHASLASHAGGGHHIVAVGVGAIAGKLRIDPGAPLLGMLELLQDQHTAAACNDEAIAVLVEGTRGLGRLVVALGGQSAHAVKHGSELPALVLPCAGHGHVRLVHLDLLHGHTDAVGAR